jgi:hypothetical protein
MNVFYRYNASNSADAGAYAVTGTTPVALSATNFASLALVKGSTSTLEIGSVYSAGTKGARLSRLATVITYTTPTPTVTTNTATVIGLSSATLNGSANPNGSGATGWYRYSTTNPGTCSDSFGTRAPVAGGDALGAGTSSVAYSEGVTSLTANTTYYVCAIASNGGGTGVGSVQSFTTLPNVPSAPSSASASNVSGTENSITWTDTSSDETGFKVERSTNDGAYVHIATTSVNATSYSDTGVTADNTYTYRVRAYNVTGNSGYSTTGYVITATVVPNTPNDFQNFVSTSTPPDVWLYITQTGTNEDGFTIERSTDNVNFGVIGTAPRAQFSNQFYSDIGPGTGTYYYRVYALNSIGNSGYSTTTIAVVP